MARVKGAMMTRKRRNKMLKLAKGYWGAKSKHFKMANEQVMKSLTYAYVGRRLKKRDFRQLWITRISAACSATVLPSTAHTVPCFAICSTRAMASSSFSIIAPGLPRGTRVPSG